MNIALYVRQSKFSSQSESIENQIFLCTEYCNQHFPNSNIHIYKDEGYSGKNTCRPGFETMINDIHTKNIKCVITYKLDRLCRNTRDFVNIIDELEKNNIDFTSVNENFDLQSTTGKMIAMLYSMFSEIERSFISERISDNMYESSKSARWMGGPSPLGYKLNTIEESNKYCTYLELDPNSINTVIYLFNAFLHHKSLTQVRNLAYKNKILGPKGNILDISTLANILRNPVYVKSSKDIVDYLTEKEMLVFGNPDNKSGFLTYAKKSSLNVKPIATVSKHPGIIEPDVWLEVQSILLENSQKSPRQGTGKKALLSGILKCALCGSNMRISYKINKSTNKESSYYICGLKKKIGKMACECSNLPADYVDGMILNSIGSANPNEIINLLEKNNILDTSIQLKSSESLVISNTIKDKEDKIKKLSTRLSLTDNPVVLNTIISSMENIAQDLDSLRKKQLIIKEKISNISSKDIEDISNAINDFTLFVNSASISSKRMLLNNIINEVLWNPNSKTINIVYKNK